MNLHCGAKWYAAAVSCVIAFALLTVAPACAQQERANDLHLIPQPREVKVLGGAPFVVSKHVTIVVDRSLGANFAGAEMLAEEIRNWTGWTPKIREEKSFPGGSDFIYIGNAADESRLRAELEREGLSMTQGFDQQGYTISSSNRRILVGGASAQGAFYGVQTLRQLLRPAQNGSHSGELTCPAVSLRDWPAMKWRGVHVDLSRGRILSLDFMKQQIRTLASYKINMYALYMEDVFALPDEPIASPQRDALTPQEIRELVNYAKPLFVTIVPELETYGHLHNVLRYDIYSPLAEIPHGSVLTPTQPGTYDFLSKMIADVAPNFPGPFFHIGADETAELGKGQTKELVAQKGLGEVYLAHIVKLDGMLKPYHKQTMFWADIAEHFPQLLSTLPKDLIAVVWTYDIADSYDNRLAPFRSAGLPIFVSPGVSNWNRIYPDFYTSDLNIRNLTRDGQKFGALGMLNTEWNDAGDSLAGLDWPGFIFGAACAWQPGESSIEDFRQSYDWAFYRNSDHTFQDILDNLAASNTLLTGVKMNGAFSSYFWINSFSEAGAYDAEQARPVTHELRVDAEHAWQSLLQNRAKARLHADTLDDLVFSARWLDALGMKLEYTQEIDDFYWDAYRNMSNESEVEHDLQAISSTNGRLEDLREQATELRAAFEQRWRSENRPFWLGNVLVRFDTMADRMQTKIQAINELENVYHHTELLPTPESLGFFLQPSLEPQNP